MRPFVARRLATLAAALAVSFGGVLPAPQLSLAATLSTAETPPSEFQIRPDVTVPQCNDGRGARVVTDRWKGSVVASGTLRDGSTLTAFSRIYPDENSTILSSVTKRCRVDASFGDVGTAEITIPRGAGSGNAGSYGLWIQSVVARQGGGALVAGLYRDRWLIGAVTPSGALDADFGHNGWQVLPYRGGITAVLQEPNGRIVVGGDNGGGGCCTVNHAAALSASGQLITGFGNDGRVKLPTGGDSGVTSLMREPNGDILARIGYGNMGCWGVQLAMLTPAGTPVPHFAHRMAKFWEARHFGAFVGDVYTHRHGFTLVGTGMHDCFGSGSTPPPATGVIQRFRTNGRHLTPLATFPYKLYGAVQAWKRGRNTLVADSSYFDTTHIRVTLRRRDGSKVAGFGKDGMVRIRTPWHGSDSSYSTELFVSEANRSALTVIATKYGSKAIHLTRLHV